MKVGDKLYYQMKIGDKLYCHTVCKMNISHIKTTTTGKYYTVVGFETDSFIIIDDDNHEHLFDFKDYNKWFWDIRELRKVKLKQITKK